MKIGKNQRKKNFEHRKFQVFLDVRKTTHGMTKLEVDKLCVYLFENNDGEMLNDESWLEKFCKEVDDDVPILRNHFLNNMYNSINNECEPCLFCNDEKNGYGIFYLKFLSWLEKTFNIIFDEEIVEFVDFNLQIKNLLEKKNENFLNFIEQQVACKNCCMKFDNKLSTYGDLSICLYNIEKDASPCSFCKILNKNIK
jgi:hypothetical protein